MVMPGPALVTAYAMVAQGEPDDRCSSCFRWSRHRNWCSSIWQSYVEDRGCRKMSGSGRIDYLHGNGVGTRRCRYSGQHSGRVTAKPGTLPLVIVHAYGAVPPLAANVVL